MGVNTLLRRLVLAITLALGLFVGIWAEFFHRSFYDDFPGLGFHWIRLMGAYDEHLISDTGSAYLAFAAISAAAVLSPRAGAGRLAGLVWTVFGVLHLAFHVSHLMGGTADQVGNVVSLTISALLGVALLVLPVGRRTGREEAA